MTQFTQYNPSDSPDAVRIWNEAIGDSFPMDLRLWEQNVNNSDFLWREASFIAKTDSGELVGFLIAKKPSNINSIVVAPKFQYQKIGGKLFELADSARKAAGSAPWIVGQDRNHFFPGVPSHLDRACLFFDFKLRFAQAPGFITDLSRNLNDFAVEQKVQDKIAELAQQGITIDPCLDSDIPSLLAHIESNFSPRWLADTKARLEIEGHPSEIIVAKKSDGSIIGFAHTYTNNSEYIGPSIYWRGLLGENYGGLGPIGVDKDHRKIGLGLALLAASIQSVRDRGATQMAIDWTVLVDFYAKVGFKPWKTYIGMRQP